MLTLEPPGIDSWARYKIGKIKKKEDEEEKDVVKELETSKPSNFASPRFRRNSVGVTPRRRASVSVSGGLSSSLVGRRRGTVADSVGGGGAIAKLSGRKKEVPFTYNEYYSDPSAITRFFEKPFEGEEEHKNKLKPAKVRFFVVLIFLRHLCRNMTLSLLMKKRKKNIGRIIKKSC